MCVKETSRGDVSFTHTKHLFYRKYLNYFMNRSCSLHPLCLKLILISKYFEKSEFECLRFYHVYCIVFVVIFFIFVCFQMLIKTQGPVQFNTLAFRQAPLKYSVD